MATEQDVRPRGAQAPRGGVFTRWWVYMLAGGLLVTVFLGVRSASTPVPADPAIVKSAVQPQP